MHRWLYEWTWGRVGHRLPGGVRCALPQTTGRKTGRARTVPLAYARDGPVRMLGRARIVPAGDPGYPRL